uniref:Ycf1 n=1 Tax=Prototheca zopfii TaxID=3112 RepID=A0A2P1G7R3_9CHLO|nr:ycf1 [Prototheca bovis]AVM80984.1 ycf1 [Prototheca bovis]
MYFIVLIRDYIQRYNRSLSLKRKKQDANFIKKIKKLIIYLVELKGYTIFSLIPNEVIGFKAVNFFINNPSFFVIYAHRSNFVKRFWFNRAHWYLNKGYYFNQVYDEIKRFKLGYSVKVVINGFTNSIAVSNLLSFSNDIVQSVNSLFIKGASVAFFSILTISPYYIYCLKKMYYDGFVTLAPSFIGYILGHFIYLISFKFVPKFFIFIYSWERLNILFGAFMAFYLGYNVFIENAVLFFYHSIRDEEDDELCDTVETEFEPRKERILRYTRFFDFIFPLFKQIFSIKTYIKTSFFMGLLCALMDQPRIYPLLSNFLPSLAPTFLEFILERNDSIYILLGYYCGYLVLVFFGLYLFFLFRIAMIYIANINFREIKRRIQLYFNRNPEAIIVLLYKKISHEDKELYIDREFPENELGLYGRKFRYILSSIIYTLAFSIIMYYPFGYFTLGSLGFVSQDTSLYGTVFDPYSLKDCTKVMSMAVGGHETGPYKVEALDRGRFGHHPAFSQLAPFTGETFRFRPEMVKYRLLNFVDFFDRSIASVPLYLEYIPLPITKTVHTTISYKSVISNKLMAAFRDYSCKANRMAKFRAIPELGKVLFKYSKHYYGLAKPLKLRRLVARNRNRIKTENVRGVHRTFKRRIFIFGEELPLIKDVVGVGVVYKDKDKLMKTNIDRFYNWYMEPFNRMHTSPFLIFAIHIFRHCVHLPARFRPIESLVRVRSLNDLKYKSIIMYNKDRIRNNNPFSFLARDCRHIPDSQVSTFYSKLGFSKYPKFIGVFKKGLKNKYKRHPKFYKKRLFEFKQTKRILLPTGFFKYNAFDSYITFKGYQKVAPREKFDFFGLTKKNIFYYRGKAFNPVNLKVLQLYNNVFFPIYNKTVVRSYKRYREYLEKETSDSLFNFRYAYLDRLENNRLNRYFRTPSSRDFSPYFVMRLPFSSPRFDTIMTRKIAYLREVVKLARKLTSFVTWAQRDSLTYEMRGKHVRNFWKGKTYNEKTVKDGMASVLRLFRTKAKVTMEIEIVPNTVYMKNRVLLFLRRYNRTYHRIYQIIYNVVYRNPFIRNISPNQESDLHYKKLFYLQFLNYLRKYNFNIYMESQINHPFKSVFFKNNCKSFANKYHNQQFKGTIVRIRRYFTVTQEDKYRVFKRFNGEFFNIMKYDNLFYNDDHNLTYHSELDYYEEDDLSNKMVVNQATLTKYKDPTVLRFKKSKFARSYLSPFIKNRKDFLITMLKNNKISPFIEKLNYHPLALLTNMKMSFLGQQDLSNFIFIRQVYNRIFKIKGVKYLNEDLDTNLYEHKTQVFSFYNKFKKVRLRNVVRFKGFKNLYKYWPLTREKIDTFYAAFRDFESKFFWFNALDSVRKSIYWEPCVLQLNAFVHSNELFNFPFARVENYVQYRRFNFMEAHNFYAYLNDLSFKDSPHWLRRSARRRATKQEESIFTYLSYKARLRRFMPSFLRYQSFYRVYDRGFSDRFRQSTPMTQYYWINKPTLGGYYWKGSDLTATLAILIRNFLLFMYSLIFFRYDIEYENYQFPFETKKWQADQLAWIKRKFAFKRKKIERKLREDYAISMNKREFINQNYLKVYKKTVKNPHRNHLKGIQWKVRKIKSKELIITQKGQELLDEMAHRLRYGGKYITGLKFLKRQQDLNITDRKVLPKSVIKKLDKKEQKLKEKESKRLQKIKQNKKKLLKKTKDKLKKNNKVLDKSKKISKETKKGLNKDKNLKKPKKTLNKSKISKETKKGLDKNKNLKKPKKKS